jgi:DNA-binding transcriptional MerR regulator
MDKSPDAFRTISEVAEDLDLPQHVLRFWETRFNQIKPLKRGGGRRYYRPDDIELLKGIRHLLYGEGYTIKGVQRILKTEGIRFVQSVGRGEQNVDAPEKEERADNAEAAPGLGGDGVDRLRGALDELVECDRVLSALRTPADPAE